MHKMSKLLTGFTVTENRIKFTLYTWWAKINKTPRKTASHIRVSDGGRDSACYIRHQTSHLIRCSNSIIQTLSDVGGSCRKS